MEEAILFVSCRSFGRIITFSRWYNAIYFVVVPVRKVLKCSLYQCISEIPVYRCTFVLTLSEHLELEEDKIPEQISLLLVHKAVKQGI